MKFDRCCILPFRNDEQILISGTGRGMSMINIMSRHPDAELVTICDKYEPFEKQCKKVADETGPKINILY